MKRFSPFVFSFLPLWIHHRRRYPIFTHSESGKPLKLGTHSSHARAWMYSRRIYFPLFSYNGTSKIQNNVTGVFHRLREKSSQRERSQRIMLRDERAQKRQTGNDNVRGMYICNGTCKKFLEICQKHLRGIFPRQGWNLELKIIQRKRVTSPLKFQVKFYARYMRAYDVDLHSYYSVTIIKLSPWQYCIKFAKIRSFLIKMSSLSK